MKVVVLGGAAHMAQPAVEYLIEEEVVEQLVLADINFERVDKISKQLGSKVTAAKLDVNDQTELIEMIKDANLVMNFIGPYYRYGTKSLRAAIDAGVNYLDICDDYDVTIEALKLDGVAKQREITALTGMGASPGITNILSRLGADALDQTEEINTYWVVGDAEPSGFGALVHMFHIIEGRVPTFMDGEHKDIKAFQKETSKTIDFDYPVGQVTLYHVGHPEPVTLPKFIHGVKKVTNLGALLPEFQNPMFKTLVDLGLTSEEPIMFKNQSVAPLEFLLTLFHHKQANAKPRLGEKPQSISAARIEVIGYKDGKQASYTFTKSGFDNMASGTSIPAGVAAKLLLEGEVDVKGVISPECLDPKKVISHLKSAKYFDEGRGFQVDRVINGKSERGSILDIDKFPELW